VLKGLGNLANLLKNAHQIGEHVESAKEKLRHERVTGNAGGGMVTVEMNGLGEVLQLKIDPTLVERNETEMIEDLVPAAVNEARVKAQLKHAETLRSVTTGLELPIPGIEKALETLAGSALPPSEDEL
jgi:DNA-binding YbaB/EbfC family protein